MALTGQAWSDAIRNAGLAYGTNPALLAAINKYEQSGTSNFVVNDWDSNAAAGTPSGGPFQFIKPTFDVFARQAREANPQAWRGVKFDWRDPQAQALAASWAFANGKGSHWSTYKKALSDVGGKTKGATGVASMVRSGGVSGPSEGMPGGKAAALRFIFDDSPIIQLAASRLSQPAPVVGSGPMGRGGGGKDGVPARRPGETGQQYLDRVLMAKFGLKHDPDMDPGPGHQQMTGGKHAGRGHGDGRATDFGDARNDPATLAAADDYLDRNAKALGLKFAWYGDDDAGHRDHLHAETLRAIRGGKKRPA